MTFSEIGAIHWVVLVVNLVILLGWPGLALLALFALRGHGLAGTALALWVLIVVAVPFLGRLAFFVLRPRGPADGPDAQPKATP
jgi:hypothetical protein